MKRTLATVIAACMLAPLTACSALMGGFGRSDRIKCQDYAYTGLIEMARALGEQDAVGIFEENLKQEREALREVESVEKTIRDEIKAGAV